MELIINESDIISTTSDMVEYDSFLLNFSTGDIEEEWFYGEEQVSDKEIAFPQKKKTILKILDGKIYGIIDKKLPLQNKA